MADLKGDKGELYEIIDGVTLVRVTDLLLRNIIQVPLFSREGFRVSSIM